MIKTFLNDSDGFTIKDFLVVTFTLTFVLLITIALFEWLQGKSITGILSIIETLTTPYSIVLAGVFTMGSVQVFSQGKQVTMSQQQMNPYNQYGGYGGYNSYYSPYNNYQPIQQPIIKEENTTQNATNTNTTGQTTKSPV